MKVSAIILGVFLVPILSLTAHAETLSPQESSMNGAFSSDVSWPIPKLINAKFRAPASIEFEVDASPTCKVLIESSSDLINWTSEGLWPATCPSFSPIQPNQKHTAFTARSITQ